MYFELDRDGATAYMLFTSFVFVTALISSLRSLRNIWFVVYALLLLLFSYWIDTVYRIGAFDKYAIVFLIILHFVFINLVTFAVYAYDKFSARRGGWRVPERSLHAFGMLGGTPSAYLAQRILRHKTKKSSFRTGFYLTIVIQVAILIAAYYSLSERDIAFVRGVVFGIFGMS